MYHTGPNIQGGSLSGPVAPTLQRFPQDHGYRYTEKAKRALLQYLFYSLAGHGTDRLKLFFPHGLPSRDKPWKLSEAQGAKEGAEYSAAAKGKRCGHILKAKEAAYTCKTCSTDDTVVLCGRCFDASNHEGHQISVHLSSGSSGCCDCGDTEAWTRPIDCSIHTAHDIEHDDTEVPSAGRRVNEGKQRALPEDLQDSIRTTIGVVLDYVCDVFSCSPEHMRTPRHQESVLRDEELARLSGDWYGKVRYSEACKEYALVLWNDEKHTVDEVEEQVAQACRETRTFGRKRALEVDAVGRSVVAYSKDLRQMLLKARILEQIKVTVTIRSTRDIFREEMCATIVDWLTDISGCSVGDDNGILMETVCAEMLKPWRIGSNASNLSVAKAGLADQERDDDRLSKLRLQRRVNAARQAAQQARVDIQLVVGEAARVDGTRVPVQEDSDDDLDDDYDFEPATRDLVEDAMDLDDGPPGRDANVGRGTPLDTGRLSDGFDAMSIQATSSAREVSDDDASVLSPQRDPSELLDKTLFTETSQSATPRPPGYWLATDNSPVAQYNRAALAVEESLDKYVRVDFMILYDLRMWKVLRDNLRHLYISTVIMVPNFKRLLGLRFAAVYRILAQLFLVADREPDHSVINLSLQMLTTPSIAEEITQRWDFFPKLLAILYTFLTKRQVGAPQDVDLRASVASEHGAMTNRRIQHFFTDMKYLLESGVMQDKVKTQDQYLLQILDFFKLHQGIYPNVRATGEHIEYESDSWMATGNTIRNVTTLCREFCKVFQWNRAQDPSSICRAIRQTAKTAITTVAGLDPRALDNPEAQPLVSFKTVEPFQFERQTANYQAFSRNIVDFTVESSPMSFHHVLHYTLSWLIECGKSMSRDQLRGLILFSQAQLQMRDAWSSGTLPVEAMEPEAYMLALFDIPMRVYAWLAQIRVGLWVRNGVSLRHQMLVYRDVSQRDESAQRDIFLLQVALVMCSPETFVASLVDRYGVAGWMRGEFAVNEGWEPSQMVDIAEDLLHMLVILVSDRTLLRPIEEDPKPEETIARREIIHALCLKPLSYSDLQAKVTPKVYRNKDFDRIILNVADYKPPEGLQDVGCFELKDAFYADIDPYSAFYSKNQREDAELAWRTHESKVTRQHVDQVVFEPRIAPIKSGVFASIASVTQTPVFSQIIWASLKIALRPTDQDRVLPTHIEAFLPTILHLMLIAIAEDKVNFAAPQPHRSFCDATIHTLMPTTDDRIASILSELHALMKIEGQHVRTRPKVELVIRRIREKRPLAFDQMVKDMGLQTDQGLSDREANNTNVESAVKKQKAQERQAKLMESLKKQQSAFMANQPTNLESDDWSEVGSDVDMDNDATKKTWTFPRDTCIFCQEDTDDQSLYGTLAYISKSNFFRCTDLSNHDHLQDLSGTLVELQYAKIAPTSRRKGSGKGWSPAQTKTVPVSTGCGHLMHWSCFERFNAATERRQNFQIARNHPERLALKEFVCPLCKALGNLFLPVVWKPKTIHLPADPAIGDFDKWLTAQAPFLVSRVFDVNLYRQECSRYINDAFLGNYAVGVSGRTGSGVLATQPTEAARHWPMPAFLGGRPTPPSRLSPTNDHAEPIGQRQHRQMIEAYRRLKLTLDVNNILRIRERMTNKINSSTEVLSANILAFALSASISTAEIAQRGTELPLIGTSVLDPKLRQTLTHLRILSETCTSYFAISNVQNPVTLSESIAMVNAQVYALFGNALRSFQQYSLESHQAGLRKPLLEDDIFDFFTSASVFLAPCLQLDIQHILRLCLLAEITKVAVAIIDNHASVSSFLLQDDTELVRRHAKGKGNIGNSTDPMQDFPWFAQQIIGYLKASKVEVGISESFPEVDENPNSRYTFDRFLRRAVLNYALPFLRKALILMHVRGGIDFLIVTDADPSESEVDSLSRKLGIPTVDELVTTMLGDTPASQLLRQLVQHWISSWLNSRKKQRFDDMPSEAGPTSTPKFSQFRSNPILEMGTCTPMSPSSTDDIEPSRAKRLQDDSTLQPLALPHPAIYELVAMPTAHDELNAIAQAHRCPTSGGPMYDPSLCLLCGTLICSQGTCCARANQGGRFKGTGGCFQHQAICGGTIGMYLTVNTCAILLMNGRHGSWFPAPYLDSHGETDMALKRHVQLYLNEMRAEKGLRNMWLEHGVASAVARKLEGDVNTGGWETL